MANSEATGQFHVVNGAVVDLNGNSFFAKGINVSDSQMNSADQILALLPGINFIRLGVYSYQAPSAYAAFIKTMSDHGVVVELEDHNNGTVGNNGGGEGNAFTGAQLAAESAWYASVASAYASNPYVWFGTNNEPPLDGLSPWQEATYNAIRGAGNTNPIMMEWPGGGVPNLDLTGHGMDPAVYIRMTNIISDMHYYGWESQFSTDQTVVDSTLATMIVHSHTMESGDGVVPIILGEYGPSTDGTQDDANNQQVIQTVQKSTDISGAIAFAWNPGTNDNATDGQGNLTDFGNRVAQFIAGRSAPPTVGAMSDIVEPDRLSFVLSADSAQATPQFIASMDGVALTPEPASVVAQHGVDTQTFDFSGAWGVGAHVLEITAVADLAGSTGGQPQPPLYVEQVSFNGHAALSQTQPLFSDSPIFLQVSS